MAEKKTEIKKRPYSPKEKREQRDFETKERLWNMLEKRFRKCSRPFSTHDPNYVKLGPQPAIRATMRSIRVVNLAP